MRTTLLLVALCWMGQGQHLQAQTEAGKPNTTITNSIGMPLVRIEPGEFWMGSLTLSPDVADWYKAERVEERYFSQEYPRHKVRITKPFFMGKYEVTRGEFRKFVEATNYQTEPERDGNGGEGWNQGTNKLEKGPQYTWQNPGWTPHDDTHPVVNVTWNDTQRFCKWLSQKEKTPYRLATEAEWEYACRAGTETLLWNGDAPENLPHIANVADATAKEKFPNCATIIKGRDGYIFTAPVGTYPANPWGLHDMLGNVSEFCADVYDDTYRNRAATTAEDPYVTSTPINPVKRVYRGGNYFPPSVNARSARRVAHVPNNAISRIGFRVVSAAGP